jgi:hypothetical protein
MQNIMKRSQKLFLLVAFFNAASQSAIDNRYLPMFNNAYQHQLDKQSVLFSNVFIATADEGYVDLKGNVSLPELFGKYDMIKAANALVTIGKSNPLPTSWQSLSSLEWDMSGKLHAQGFWFGYEQYLYKNISIGFQAPFMHLSTQIKFSQSDSLKSDLGLGVGGESMLYKTLNNVNKELGIESYQWKKTAFGDLDLYLRWSSVQGYTLKCKHIDASFKIGALLPMSDSIDLNSPMAIPFGGYNHYGFYFETDFNCELKDDWKVGFWLNATKRKSKVQVRRMSAGKELPQFGALTGNVFVDPGLTVGFSPYIWLDDIRDGLGVRGSFTLSWHSKDYWRDVREDDLGLSAHLSDVIKTSEWESEYFTVGLVYDLQQAANYRRYAPCFYLNLDIPSRVFDADRVSKTHRLTFGFEFNF